ncbi:hypothetical protein M5K25_026511 [Dendrobium thyrsiflorum]|uniref:Uncharacterized protein n=1 Tax=Dendrobium thyrsiflorum TaxID=117978 RepID=A0ABD0TXR4_DENTH
MPAECPATISGGRNAAVPLVDGNSPSNAPLIIREPTFVKPKTPTPVIGKGKEIVGCVDMKTPRSLNLCRSNDLEASSSSGLKLFVNRFGNAVAKSIPVSEGVPSVQSNVVDPSSVCGFVQDNSLDVDGQGETAN